MIPVTRPPIPDGAVGVADGRIVFVGRRDEAPAGARTIALGNSFLLPGLVNAHTHLELTVMRGYLEDGPFRPWLLRLTAARSAALNDEALVASARLGVAEGLLAGITTYADTSSTGAAFTALHEMGVRGISYQEVFGPHPGQCEEAMTELRQRTSLLASRRSPLVTLGISPHAPYTVSDALYRAAGRYATEQALPVAVHIAESPAERALVAEATGPFADGWRDRGIPVGPRARSPVQLLEATGILALRPLLIHCVQIDDTDIAMIVAAKAPVVHNPASNAKLGHGIAPLRDLIAAGAPVALGTDSVASNNRMDLLDEARIAVLFSRARGAEISASKALQLATIGGARALGWEREIGSLEVGKAADLAAFPVDEARDEPIYDAVTAVVFGGGGRRASMVCVGGVELVRDGGLLATLDGDRDSRRAAAERLRVFAVEGETPRGLDFSGVRLASD